GRAGTLRTPRCARPRTPPPGPLSPATAPRAAHLRTSTGPTVPICTEPPTASELEFCSYPHPRLGPYRLRSFRWTNFVY
uniref:Uncharacterized protein n=2 Tax=Canis lupus familiaris TaxID=9615 RepID=A0A8C0M986_CANLF